MHRNRHRFAVIAALALAMIIFLNVPTVSADAFNLTATIPLKQRLASSTITHYSKAGWWPFEVSVSAHGQGHVSSFTLTWEDGSGTVVASFTSRPAAPWSMIIGPLPEGTYTIRLSITGTQGGYVAVQITHCDPVLLRGLCA